MHVFWRISRYAGRKGAAAFVLLAAIWIASAQPAEAQISLQIGGSESEFKARLARDGYDRIDTVKIGMSNSLFRACKQGKRYSIKFEWTGRVERRVIGQCRQIANLDSIRDLLRQQGYRRINIENHSGRYLAIACRDSKRFRIELNNYGDIKRERRIGRCERILSPVDIATMLEEKGYNRIDFIHRQPPVYAAVACFKRDRVKMNIETDGRIVSEQRIGRCRSAVKADELVGLLEQKGLTRVTVIDATPPRYLAEACRGDRRVEVEIGRWGKIHNETRVGRCRQSVTVDEIAESMRGNGYTNVSVHKRGREFSAKGCRDNRYMEFILTSRGELVSRDDLGSCTAPRINELAEKLRSRGLRQLKFFAEGCNKGQRVRIQFDEFANRIGRQVLGGC